MRKFFYNIGQSLSLFSDENNLQQQNVIKTEDLLNSKIENKSDPPSSSSTNDNDDCEKIRNILLEDLKNNRVIDKNNLHKIIKEHLKKRRINDNFNSSTTAEAILALLQEIQLQLQSILNTSNFITYEEQYTEILIGNLKNDIFENFVSNQEQEEPKKTTTPLAVVCQIKAKHKRINVTDKDVDQNETSAKGERHIQDEEYFEEFFKEIQEGLNRGFYRKRRRYWSRFSFSPSSTISECQINQSSDKFFKKSNQLLSSMTVSDENLKKIETPFNLTTVNRSETFFDCANKKIEKFPLSPLSPLEDENNPFQNSSNFLSPTSSINQKISIESNRNSKISSDDSPSRSVESTSNASSLSLSNAFQFDEIKPNGSEQKIINTNLQSDMELSREMNVLEEQNNNINNNTEKSEDVESASSGPNLLITDESVLKLARALNIAKRFQNENKVLWQQITRLKNLINEKDLEIKRVKLHSKKEASQDEVKILKDKLTILEQEQSNMSQNLRKSEKLCREYERDLDGLEKNLEFAEQRRKSFKSNCICIKSESSKQNFNIGTLPEIDNKDQESEIENLEYAAEGSSCFQLKGNNNKTENSSTEKADNSSSSSLMKRSSAYEKSISGHTLRNSRLRKEFKNNKTCER